MQKGIVIRDDNVWQGHPDVALFKNKLFVAYRESGEHLVENQSSIKITTHRAKNKYFNKWTQPQTIASGIRFNCPRLCVHGKYLYLICDVIPTNGNFIDGENSDKTRIWIWRTENGENWENPIKTNIQGIVPDRIVKTSEGFLLATHTHKTFNKPAPPSSNKKIGEGDVYAHGEKFGRLVQQVWKSKNISDRWIGPINVAASVNHNFCEASICHANPKTLIALMRENSRRGEPAYRCISHDNGNSWTKPQKTRLFGCHRPVTGKLRSGNFLTTYRDQVHSVNKPFWAKNTVACLTTEYSMIDVASPLVHSITLNIDHDSSKQSDGGYTGWVQLEDDTIFVVNYITDNAPLPHIRWYTLQEKEF